MNLQNLLASFSLDLLDECGIRTISSAGFYFGQRRWDFSREGHQEEIAAQKGLHRVHIRGPHLVRGD